MPKSSGSNAVPVNGAAIRTIRKLLGLDQTTFAQRVGKNRAYIAHIEAGRRSPSPETFQAIVEVLKLEDRTAILAPLQTRLLPSNPSRRVDRRSPALGGRREPRP